MAEVRPRGAVADASDNPDKKDHSPLYLKARRLGIDSHDEAQVYLHKDCVVSRSEGFSAHTRVAASHNGDEVLAHFYPVTSNLVQCDEAGFSDAAWKRLGLAEGAPVRIRHAPPLESLSAVRGKVYGRAFDAASLKAIVGDIVAGRYSNIQLSAFVTACAARPLEFAETLALTEAMVEAGERIVWGAPIVADKHCVGGLPGNRTTPIVVAIAAACGLIIPKTSSRAITSPAGTADAMETLAPVDLDAATMRRVVDAEGGCIVWGGAVRLSPADDIMIRVERVLDFDAEGQLIASILSKKIAAGATCAVIDVPIGPTAKIRNREAALTLSRSLINIGAVLGIGIRTVMTDGTQPVGRGIGPALEAREVLAVLQNAPGAPADLRDRALLLAGEVLELGGAAAPGEGLAKASQILSRGEAWSKFQRICEAQGGMRSPPVADHTHVVEAGCAGRFIQIDNRRIAKVAKLAGAPDDRAAGVELHVRLGEDVMNGQPLYTIHADSPGQLGYALGYATANPDLVAIVEP